MIVIKNFFAYIHLNYATAHGISARNMPHIYHLKKQILIIRLGKKNR
jgi:hypothetical protein